MNLSNLSSQAESNSNKSSANILANIKAKTKDYLNRIRSRMSLANIDVPLVCLVISGALLFAIPVYIFFQQNEQTGQKDSLGALLNTLEGKHQQIESINRDIHKLVQNYNVAHPNDFIELEDISHFQYPKTQEQILSHLTQEGKDVSYSGLLNHIKSQFAQINQLQSDIKQLMQEPALPEPHIVQTGENHYKIALNFLTKQGMSTIEARKLVDKAHLLDPLLEGFAVHMHYTPAQEDQPARFYTFVDQGRAKVSPGRVQHHVTQKAKQAEQERNTLNKMVSQIQSKYYAIKDMPQTLDRVRAERDSLYGVLDAHASINQGLEHRVSELRQKIREDNSIHVAVGQHNAFKDIGILKGWLWRTKVKPEAPVSAFIQPLDLRQDSTIVVFAGGKELKKVRVYGKHESLKAKKDYELTYSNDKQKAFIRILDGDAQRGKKRFLDAKYVAITYALN